MSYTRWPRVLTITFSTVRGQQDCLLDSSRVGVPAVSRQLVGRQVGVGKITQSVFFLSFTEGIDILFIYLHFSRLLHQKFLISKNT